MAIRRICGNRFQLDKVERLLTQRWQEPTLFGEQRQLCDKAETLDWD
jgi:hypothetical protein